MSSYWDELERPGPQAVEVDGVVLRRRSRVRLHPRADGGDIFARALDGRTAMVDAIVTSTDERVQLAVVVDDDPGRDLPGLRRYFFAVDEVEPLEAVSRVLVAGIGNVFLGDDGFGVALAGRLARRVWPPGVDVVDFGIRGMDLALAMGDYDAAVLLDAVPRNEPPGTLFVIEPSVTEDAAVDAHGMDPVAVLALARRMGGALPRTLVVGCQPQSADEAAELSAPVAAALAEAEQLVCEVVQELVEGART
jgi:hydrogenase maturation protease